MHDGIWILAEQSKGKIQSVSYELLNRAVELAAKRKCAVAAVLFGANVPNEELQELIYHGADQVLYTEAPELANFLPEPYAACMLQLIQDYKPEIIIAGATSTGRTLMPYVAIKANAGLTADCTVLDIEEGTGNLLQTRPAIGGNILATIKTPEHRPQMATVRPHSTKPAPRQQERTGQIVRMQPPEQCLKSRVKHLEFIPNNTGHSLQDADYVVAVGRGIKKCENIQQAAELAELLDAALGASRDVVDRGWLDYPYQVGLSGKTINPTLYVALGISGAIQHLAGMQTSETIIAINSDPDAQIFSVADFGIVGDVFDILPRLCEKLRAIRETLQLKAKCR